MINQDSGVLVQDWGTRSTLVAMRDEMIPVSGGGGAAVQYHPSKTGFILNFVAYF